VKLDIFNHIFPKAFWDRMLEVVRPPKPRTCTSACARFRAFVDLDDRFRIMDTFGDYAQVICLAQSAHRGARGSGDRQRTGHARQRRHGRTRAQVSKRFPGFIASLPMNDPDGLLKEATRAVNELGAVGVQCSPT